MTTDKPACMNAACVAMRRDLNILRQHNHEGCMAEIERLRVLLLEAQSKELGRTLIEVMDTLPPERRQAVAQRAAEVLGEQRIDDRFIDPRSDPLSVMTPLLSRLAKAACWYDDYPEWPPSKHLVSADDCRAARSLLAALGGAPSWQCQRCGSMNSEPHCPCGFDDSLGGTP